MKLPKKTHVVEVAPEIERANAIEEISEDSQELKCSSDESVSSRDQSMQQDSNSLGRFPPNKRANNFPELNFEITSSVGDDDNSVSDAASPDKIKRSSKDHIKILAEAKIKAK